MPRLRFKRLRPHNYTKKLYYCFVGPTSYVVKGNKEEIPFFIFTDTDDCSGISLTEGVLKKL